MNDKIKIKEGGTHGVVTLTWCDMRSKEAQKLQEKIIAISGKTKNWKKYRALVDELHSKFAIKKLVIDNLCPTVGRAVIAQRLANDITYTGTINYCALGTGTGPAANGDTQLATETYRKLANSRTNSSNIAYISTFFSATEVTGTFKEVGHFIDGTATADSGQLFSRITDVESAELPKTKTSVDSLTIDYKVTIS